MGTFPSVAWPKEESLSELDLSIPRVMVGKI